MKLKVFYASDGDCLLLESSDGHHALIDGGRSASFQKVAWPELQKLATLDLVVVSHIDADHISGILWLMKVVADWTVYDYQRGPGRNKTFPPPRTPRPPVIKRFWHNSWHAQLRDLAGTIEEFVGHVGPALDLATTPAPAASAIRALQGLGESIPDGVELLRTVENDTPVPLNGKPFDSLVMLHRPPRSVKLGRTKLTVIGPGKAHLEALRDEWREWLATMNPDGTGPEQAVGSLVQAAQIIDKTDPSKVTPPNHASITLLAEEGGERACSPATPRTTRSSTGCGRPGSSNRAGSTATCSRSSTTARGTTSTRHSPPPCSPTITSSAPTARTTTRSRT